MMNTMTFTKRAINEVANIMQAQGGDRGTIKMMHNMVLVAVSHHSETVTVENPAVIGFMQKYAYRLTA